MSSDARHLAVPALAHDLPYRSRMISRALLAPDVWLVQLEKPQGANAAVVPWHFDCGQYTTLGVPDVNDALLRPYSIASSPHDDHIAFHIRDTGHGLSHALASQIQTGDTVALAQPAGSSVPATAHSRPLLLLAGGVGIAPMMSIVSARTARSPACHLYWGVSDHSQLYLHDHWQQQHANGTLAGYHALTEAPAPAPALRQGMIGPAVVHDFADLAPYAIYLAGPAAMVAATVPLLIAHGAQKEYIFGDGITV